MKVSEQILDQLLAALRQWGWGTGLHKLREPGIADTLDETARAALERVRELLAQDPATAEQLTAPPRARRRLAELLGWARAEQADVVKRNNLERADDLLVQALPRGPVHPALRATISHYRGALLCHQDRPDEALTHLHEALELFGKEHYITGRVLDTLGMAYAAKDTYTTAREFYERAVAHKEAWQDWNGLAVSHGKLGLLALDWGDAAEAEKHLLADLELSLTLGGKFGAYSAALMYARRGEAALAAGRLARAAEFLDESIRRCRGQWLDVEGLAHIEGFAHKDRALVYLAVGDLARAEEEIGVAEQVFRQSRFAEGLAHVERARGRLLRARGRYDEAEQALATALAYFEGEKQRQKQRAEVARTQWERAQVAKARGASPALVADALLRALDSAEHCRRHTLVRLIEAELLQVDEAEYWRRNFQRVRGQGVGEETFSLMSGHRETATVLFLDLQGSTDYMRVTDPETVTMTINQMMMNLSASLEKFQATVTAYLGDGFMALVRGRDHARRGVSAAVALSDALEEFNRPRRTLDLPPLLGRVGVSTGELFLGNVGTYQKMDFTALGTTVNLAARLQPEAELGCPCISRETYEQVHDHFRFKSDKPRTVHLKGLGDREVWDVIGLKDQPERRRG